MTLTSNDVTWLLLLAGACQEAAHKVHALSPCEASRKGRRAYPYWLQGLGSGHGFGQSCRHTFGGCKDSGSGRGSPAVSGGGGCGNGYGYSTLSGCGYGSMTGGYGNYSCSSYGGGASNGCISGAGYGHGAVDVTSITLPCGLKLSQPIQESAIAVILNYVGVGRGGRKRPRDLVGLNRVGT